MNTYSTSDRSKKDAIEDLPLAECQHMLANVSARKFVRTDFGEDPTKRFRKIGFIADEIAQYQIPYASNLVEGQSPDQSVAYDRIACILWQVVKNQEDRIKALEAQQPKKRKAT